MKILILCTLALFTGIVAKAQSGTAFLSITLTDLQSVKFNNVSSKSVVSPTEETAPNGSLQVLRESISQVKTIQSNSSEYERLYKEIYSGTATDPAASSDRNFTRMAVNRDPGTSKRSDVTNLVIYQIDPR